MVRRSARSRNRRQEPAVKQLPWQQLVNPYSPIEVLSADQIEAIHQSSLALLERTGMRVLHEEGSASIIVPDTPGDTISLH